MRDIIISNSSQLFQYISSAIEQKNVSDFLDLAANYPHLSMLFDKEQLGEISGKLSALLKNEPKTGEWHCYLLETRLLKEKNLTRFFNEVSFATANADTEIRIMIPENTQQTNVGFPDLLVLNKETHELTGLELKHYRSPIPRIVPEPRYHKTSYEILTRDELKPHYHQFPWVSRVYTYSDFYPHGRSPQYYKMYWEHQKIFNLPKRQNLVNIFNYIKK